MAWAGLATGRPAPWRRRRGWRTTAGAAPPGVGRGPARAARWRRGRWAGRRGAGGRSRPGRAGRSRPPRPGLPGEPGRRVATPVDVPRGASDSAMSAPVRRGRDVAATVVGRPVPPSAARSQRPDRAGTCAPVPAAASRRGSARRRRADRPGAGPAPVVECRAAPRRAARPRRRRAPRRRHRRRRCSQRPRTRRRPGPPFGRRLVAGRCQPVTLALEGVRGQVGDAGRRAGAKNGPPVDRARRAAHSRRQRRDGGQRLGRASRRRSATVTASAGGLGRLPDGGGEHRRAGRARRSAVTPWPRRVRRRRRSGRCRGRGRTQYAAVNSVDRSAGEGGDDGTRGRAWVDPGSPRPELVEHRVHQGRVEGVVDLQPAGPRPAALRRPLDARPSRPGDDHLAGPVHRRHGHAVGQVRR